MDILIVIPLMMVASILAIKAIDRFLARFGWSHSDHVKNLDNAMISAGCNWVCDTFESEGGTAKALYSLRKFVNEHDRDIFWIGMVEGIKVIEQTSKLRRL